MAVEKKPDHTEDDEDLEALRLAALNSLKKKNDSAESAAKTDFNVLPYKNYKGSFRGGKRRYFSGSSSRGSRNGQYNAARNTNLIAIPTSAQNQDEIDARTKKFTAKNDDPPKLVLPQDRYANAKVQEAENDGPSSKFDRYDNSNSESEDDDEILETKLERCDSLEALMEELDAEISGEPLKERKTKVKKDASSEEKPQEDEENEADVCANGDKEETNSAEVIVHNENSSKEIDKPVEEKTECAKKVEITVERKNVNKPNMQRSPGQRKIPTRRANNSRVFKPLPPVNNPVMIPNQPFLNPLQAPQFTTVYNTVPSYTIPEAFPINVPPPFIPPPTIQPHIIPVEMAPVGFNVPPLQPITIPPQDAVPMGPLSPRSAAFVLQNRAIVEKRKRSPRRSFSRSPSPPPRRARYSKSPVSGRSRSPVRRSLSPVRRPFSPLQRTLSPRRSPVRRSLSPYRRNKSPRRDSPRRSPRRARVSPKRTKESPKRTKESRRTPVKDRLGNRNKNEDKEASVKSENSISPNKSDPKPLDPILEARKKKFESKEINVKERVIRLKPKEEPAPKKQEPKSPVTKSEDSFSPKTPEECQLKRTENTLVKSPAKASKKEENSTRIVLLPKNETKSLSQANNPEKSQDQIEDAINELEMLLKDDEALELSAKVDDFFTDEEVEESDSKKSSTVREDRSKVVLNGANKVTSDKKRETKSSKWKFEESKPGKPKKTKKEPLTNPIENRRIEIKIRNPSKYEKNGSKQGSNARTVELTKKDAPSEEDTEPEIVEEEENVEEVAASREGDLRAQLSRKRAERQSKLPSLEGVQSRLLQSALEGAVFKKKKSKRKEKETKECCVVKKLIKKHRCIAGRCDLAVQSRRKVRLYRRLEVCSQFLTDVKLPIHLRLGIAHDSDIFAESIVPEKISRKKSKKRKHADMEQVLCLMRILFIDYFSFIICHTFVVIVTYCCYTRRISSS